MGVIRIPDTAAAMDGLDVLMEDPIRAGSRRAGRIAEYLDSDNLADMMARAGKAGPGADMRPLVAMELDELVNWTSARGWDPAALTRARELVARFRDADIERHVDRLLFEDEPAAAIAVVAAVQGLDARAAAATLDARRGFAPGTFLVRDGETGEAFRAEAVYGVVVVGPPGVAERLDAEHPAPSPAP